MRALKVIGLVCLGTVGGLVVGYAAAVLMIVICSATRRHPLPPLVYLAIVGGAIAGGRMAYKYATRTTEGDDKPPTQPPPD
jgi:hypothetical protein